MKSDLETPKLRLEGMIASNNEDYSYAYGLISGMQSMLLSRKDIEALALSPSLGDALAMLGRKDYSTEMEKLSKEFLDSELEKALRENFLRVYNGACDSLPNEERVMLDQIVFGESNLRNIKAILRALHSNRSISEVKMALQPGGNIDTQKLASSNSVEEFVANLYESYDEYSGKLDSSLEEYKKTGSIIGMEMSLDKAAVESWLSNEMLSDYVREKIDLINVLNLIRCRVAGIAYEKHMLHSGMHLSEKFLKSIEPLPASEIIPSLSGTPYGPKLSKAAVGDEINLLKIEHAFDAMLKEEVSLKAMLSPLSIWSVLAFAQKKQEEVMDVLMILLLKSHNYSPEKIRKALE